MHPYLMGASGVEDKAHQCAAFIGCGGKNFIFGDGTLPIGRNDPFHFQRDLPLQRQVDQPRSGLRHAAYHGDIPLGHGFPQLTGSNLMAGDHHRAGGILIDAVHRTEGARTALFFRQGGINACQRTEDMTARLMHRHAGRLIKNCDVPIPVQARDIGFTGRKPPRLIRQIDFQHIALLQQVNGAGMDAVEQDPLRQVLERNNNLAADALLEAQKMLNLIACVLGSNRKTKGCHGRFPPRKACVRAAEPWGAPQPLRGFEACPTGQAYRRLRRRARRPHRLCRGST